jgi:uncharacterized protein (TIGR00369 family)
MTLSQRRQDEIRDWFRKHWQEEVAFNRLCGFEITDFGPEAVRVRAAFRPELSAHEKIFHGGVLATLIDTTGSGAVIAGHDYSLGTRLTTVAMSVQFLSVAPGEDIVAEGRCTRRGRSLNFAHVLVSSASGKPLAEGMLTVNISGHRQGLPAADAVTDTGAAEAPGR